MVIIDKLSKFFESTLVKFVIDLAIIVSIALLTFSFIEHKKESLQPVKDLSKITEVYPVFVSESGEVLLIDKKSYTVKNVLSKDIVNGIFNLRINQMSKDYNKSVNR